MNIITLKAFDGSVVEFDKDNEAGSGSMKSVYFSPDKSYVVGFYRKELDFQSVERLKTIVDKYPNQIFNQEGGDNLRKLFCWPAKLVEWNYTDKKGNAVKRIGVVCPTYDSKFFFSSGRFINKEKEGKWFASAKLRNKFLDNDQKGNWLNYLQICICIARAVKKLHAAGLCHSDLSYKNILINPLDGSACLIDLDGLVVPNKFPPDVVGTPDFIAPEVMETRHLPKDDVNKVLPSINTDLHALAVLIYMYLLYRHPLRGKKIYDSDDSDNDETLAMGKYALFIEHPTDQSNRPDLNGAKDELPFIDTDKLPYTLCGPYLAELFRKAFIDSLHNPFNRPTAEEWERALIKTVDLIQPCSNSKCKAKFFVFDNKNKPVCPFCGTHYKRLLPIFNFYYNPRPGRETKFISENYRLMIFNKQSLYLWHVDRNIFPNEKLKAEDRKPLGDFHYKNKKWVLVNRGVPKIVDLTDQKNKKIILPGQSLELHNSQNIMFEIYGHQRLVNVQMANK